MSERVRHLLSKSQVLDVIDNMPKIEVSWTNDRNARRNLFAEALKSDDYSLLVGMIKGLKNERRKRIDCGKSLMSSDEKALETASRLLSSEFSHVLGIKADEVDSFIENRIGTM